MKTRQGVLYSTLYMWKGFSQITDVVVCGIFASALPKPGLGFAVWDEAGTVLGSRKIHASGPRTLSCPAKDEHLETRSLSLLPST